MASRHGAHQSIEAMRTTYLMEPIQFRIQEGALAEFLTPRGFTLREHLNTQDMERRYLTRADGTRAGHALASIFLATATHD
jgi:O-methyltransferase involved in polyketide biosynthesis